MCQCQRMCHTKLKFLVDTMFDVNVSVNLNVNVVININVNANLTKKHVSTSDTVYLQLLRNKINMTFGDNLLENCCAVNLKV